MIHYQKDTSIFEPKFLKITFPMKSCFFSALLATMLFTVPLIAQKDKDIQVIDFGDDSQEDNKQSKYKGLILKTNPISFVFGAQWLEAEKELTDYMSIQAGVGVRFKSMVGVNYNSLLEELNGTENSCDSPNWEYDICDDYSDYSIRKATAGPWFYDSDGFDGAYIAPVFRFSQARYKVQQVDENSNNETRLPDVWQNENERDIDLVIHYGYQNLHPKLTTEYFIGLGVRFNKSTRQDIGTTAFGNYQNGEKTFSQKLLRLETGIRLGFQL
jgi:hypothetical protein